MLNEFFGLFAMSGTATSFIGPAAIGVLTLVFQSQRIGVAVGLVFLVAGLLVMFKVARGADSRVDEEALNRRAAQERRLPAAWPPSAARRLRALRPAEARRAR